jgi:hypothetical protein
VKIEKGWVMIKGNEAGGTSAASREHLLSKCWIIVKVSKLATPFFSLPFGTTPMPTPQ